VSPTCGVAGDVCEACGRLGPERLHADLMSPVTWGPLRHQPHQTPGQPFLERPAGELLPRGMALRAPRHHPTSMAQRAPHVPPAVTAAMRDLAEQGILEGAALERWVDARSPRWPYELF
jgi:hypothetical protein